MTHENTGEAADLAGRKKVNRDSASSTESNSQAQAPAVAADAAQERIPFHPLADVFPLMEGVEFDELVADIKAHGLRESIVLYENRILDGRNRARACEAAGARPSYAPFRSPLRRDGYRDPVAFVISANLRRRHLDESQRAMVATKLATMRQGERTDREPSANLQKVDRATAAKLLKVSERTIASAAKVVHQGAPELVHAVEQGAVSVSSAAEIVDLPVDEQRAAVAGGKKAVVAKAKQAKGKKKITPLGANSQPCPPTEDDLARIEAEVMRLEEAWEVASKMARIMFLANDSVCNVLAELGAGPRDKTRTKPTASSGPA